MKIVIVGFACSFKTTAGQLLAQQLQCPFADTDQLVQQQCGKSIPQIFAQGEQTFRLWEDDILLQLQDFCGVVACGGGSVLSKNFEKLAQNAVVVWFQTSAQSVANRLSEGRPLFDGKSVQQLQELMTQRNALYAEFAHLCVQTDGKTPQQVAQQTAQLLQRTPK